MFLTHHHEWLPPVIPLHHCPHAPACQCLPLVSPEHSNDGEEELRALDGAEHFSPKPHYIHDDMIDAPPGLHPNVAQDMDDDVSAISNTNGFYNEQDEKENVVTTSEIKLFSPTKETLQAWRHCNVVLWSPLQDTMWTPIPSNQYLLLVAQLVLYTKMHLQCSMGFQS
jgi:hypothetical protein